MKLLVALFTVVLLTVSTAAQAKHRHHHYRHHRLHYDTIDNGREIGGRPAGCPYAFCGCGVSLHIFGRIIPDLNLASNWFRFPRAHAAPGMVAVRNHHVFAIESVIDEFTVVAYDPNSGGHRTRIHTVSLRGYRVVDPHGTRVAQAY